MDGMEDIVANGEEGEDCLFQARVKLFKLVPKIHANTEGDNKGGSGSKSSHATNVTPLFSSTTNTTTTTREPSSSKSNTEPKSTNEPPPQKEQTQTQKQVQPQQPSMDWREVGIGPLRILQNEQKSRRVVQRRETTPGGPGTKLILNALLGSTSTSTSTSTNHVPTGGAGAGAGGSKVTREGDKFVRWATVLPCSSSDNDNDIKDSNINDSNDNKKEGQPLLLQTVVHLFKVKTVAEADELERFMMESTEHKEISSTPSTTTAGVA
jgi:hypothetical protein